MQDDGVFLRLPRRGKGPIERMRKALPPIEMSTDEIMALTRRWMA